MVDRPASVSMRAPEHWLVATTEYAGLTSYTGGIGRHYAALLPALVAHGARVDLAVFSGEDPVPAPDLRGVHLLPLASTVGMTERTAIRARARHVRALAAGRRYDRIFLPDWSALGADLPRNAPLLTNLATSSRLAREVSGLRMRDIPWSRRPAVALQERREARQIERSRGVIAISAAMLRRAEAAIGHVLPAAIVGNCIDVDAVRAASATGPVPPGWPGGDEPVVLFLGRAERRKGIDDAMAAFAEVSRAYPGARLVVAGAGGDPRFEPTRTDLLSVLPDSTRARVTWLGHVAGAALYRGIRAADVVLCPSRWEGFGQVALEVKAAGAPLVVTRGSGFDDFCVDGLDCLMVPPERPRALADATVRLLEDAGLRRDLVANASARLDAFAPGPIAAELRAAADRLLGPARA